MARSKDEGIVDRILDAAFRIFGERGFDGATVRQIAAEACLSPGSIYNYFPDKDSLFDAAVERGWDGFIGELRGITAGVARREDRIAALVGSGFQTLGSAFPLIKGMLFEASRRHLIGPKVAQAIDAVDLLLAPDEGGADPGRRLEPETRRKALIRIVILGVLASSATDNGDREETVAGLRDAIVAFLSGIGGLAPALPVSREEAT